MNTSGDLALELERLVALRERRALIRTWLLSALPIVAAAGFLWFMTDRISAAQGELAQVQRAYAQVEHELPLAQQKLAEAEAQRASAQRAAAELQARLEQAATRLAEADRKLEDTAARLSEAEQKLAQSATFVENMYDLRWEEAKEFAALFARAAEILFIADEMRRRNVGWSMANREGAGYNSPGFAGVVLQRLGRLPRDLPPATVLADLPRESGPPRVGDIVVYDGGYSMFYFRDRQGVEFVVGMTPIGIAALKYEFGPRRLGVLRTGLQ